MSVPAGGNSRFAGHGVYVGRGIVLTAKHVLRGGRGAPTVTFVASGRRIPGSEMAISDSYDLAGITIKEPAGATPTPITETWPTSQVSSFRSRGTPRRGVRNDRGREVFGWNGVSVLGDSGGPVKDSQGRVVSLVCYGNHGRTYGPPPNKIVEFVRKWKKFSPT